MAATRLIRHRGSQSVASPSKANESFSSSNPYGLEDFLCPPFTHPQSLPPPSEVTAVTLVTLATLLPSSFAGNIRTDELISHVKWPKLPLN